MSWGENSIPYAIRGGEMIDADSLETGGYKADCLCPGCNSSLVAKIGQGYRVPHFAHPRQAAQECDFRTVSHRVGGHLLRRRIRRQLAAGGNLVMTWRCESCGQIHSLDLLDGVADVSRIKGKGVSTTLGLYATTPAENEKARPIRVIEVSAGSVPSEAVLRFHQASHVPVWTVAASNLRQAQMIEEDRSLGAVAALGAACPRPSPAAASVQPARVFVRAPEPRPRRAIVPDIGSCTNCGKALRQRLLYIYPWKFSESNRPEPVAIVRFGRSQGSTTVGPVSFCPAELQAAREHGADRNRGKMFYENFGGLLEELEPLATFAVGCDQCITAVDPATLPGEVTTLE